MCALLIFLISQCPSPEQVNTEIAPSELPQARINPKSYGPQHTEFTAGEANVWVSTAGGISVTVFDMRIKKREVTGRVVARVLVHLIPGAVLLLPDDHLPVVGAGRQDVAVHGVSPGHLPHGTLVAAKTESESELEFRSTPRKPWF